MNITFLIGNGFDLNLGLATEYSDFVNEYKDTPAKTTNLYKFRQHINNNKLLWSNAEIELGKSTSNFELGEAAKFNECQTDFCEHLAEYLKKQEKYLDYANSEASILSAFSKMNELIDIFPLQERAALNSVYEKRKPENIVFNFICFNYTMTLHNCLSIVNKNSNILGSHKIGAQIYRHSIGKICNVHGTIEKNMVFGVNDESQIVKPEIFECEDGDIYKNLLIKIQANASYLENTDSIANGILNTSTLIYIYGMSLGETDKLWWNRICTWLNTVPDRHLIVHKYGLRPKSVFPSHYQIQERKQKREITKYSDFEKSKNEEIEKRIHITGDNIFSDISKIAKKSIDNSNGITSTDPLEAKEDNSAKELLFV